MGKKLSLNLQNNEVSLESELMRNGFQEVRE